LAGRSLAGTVQKLNVAELVQGRAFFMMVRCGSVRAKALSAASSVHADSVQKTPLAGWARSETPSMPGERRACRQMRIECSRKAGERQAEWSSKREPITKASGPVAASRLGIQGSSIFGPLRRRIR
jgi:hypothetical protein